MCMQRKENKIPIGKIKSIWKIWVGLEERFHRSRQEG